MKRVVVTTSWDDGHKLDLKLATLLKKYKINGTFYVAPLCREIVAQMRLTDDEIKSLSKDFEIGSHTITHPVLTKISETECIVEIAESKSYLEQLLNKRITSFCYPRGAFNPAVSKAVKHANYLYARTVEEYELGMPKDYFESATSIETHRLPFPKLIESIIRLARFCNWRPLMIIKNLSWERRAKTMFNQVNLKGGVFHLWGHSWVIENERGWQKLESVLKYIHGQTDVEYLTNSELLIPKGPGK